MRALPALSVSQARLPETYEAAKTALAECTRIDECKDWADKAEALASYARQADDDTLRKMADRIQARAVRRAGELLKTYSSPGARTDLPNNGTDARSQKEAAERAKMSQRQKETAVRVANVPADDFDAAVESNDPPTVTALAEQGKKSRVPEPPEGFRQATHLIGAVRRFANFCDENAPELVAGGVLPQEIDGVRELVSTIDNWLDRFVVNLGNDT